MIDATGDSLGFYYVVHEDVECRLQQITGTLGAFSAALGYAPNGTVNAEELHNTFWLLHDLMEESVGQLTPARDKLKELAPHLASQL